MGHSKAGNKKNKPSHVRYNANGQREKNKIRRILKNNGTAFLSMWENLRKKKK